METVVIKQIVQFYESIGVLPFFLLWILILTFNLDFLEHVENKLTEYEKKKSQGKTIHGTSAGHLDIPKSVYIFEGIMISLGQWILRILLSGLFFALLGAVAFSGRNEVIILPHSIALILFIALVFGIGRFSTGGTAIFCQGYADHAQYYSINCAKISKNIIFSDVLSFMLMIMFFVFSISQSVSSYSSRSTLLNDLYSVNNGSLLIVAESIEIVNNKTIITPVSHEIPRNWPENVDWPGYIEIDNECWPNNKLLEGLRVSARNPAHLILDIEPSEKSITISRLTLLDTIFSSKIENHKIVHKLEKKVIGRWSLQRESSLGESSQGEISQGDNLQVGW
ncbi:MAG TPA: hypothetical protein PKA63_02480 [Oligoflexia bacterium]|nr:hypothetical protein [Oligoflexia bacterium]HMP47518.1 hypothetical protein [Oligoflexia bacterium]